MFEAEKNNSKIHDIRRGELQKVSKVINDQRENEYQTRHIICQHMIYKLGDYLSVNECLRRKDRSRLCFFNHFVLVEGRTKWNCWPWKKSLSTLSDKSKWRTFFPIFKKCFDRRVVSDNKDILSLSAMWNDAHLKGRGKLQWERESLCWKVLPFYGRVPVCLFTCWVGVVKFLLFMTAFHKFISTKTINGERKTDGDSDELKVFEHGLSEKRKDRGSESGEKTW